MKIELYASTKYVGSRDAEIVEIDDEEWATMSEMERDEYMLEMLWDCNLIEWGWKEVGAKK